MIEEIIIPKTTVINLSIPREMIGKTLKLIAFEIPEIEQKDQRISEIEELTESSLVDLSDFVFDRWEANNYEE